MKNILTDHDMAADAESALITKYPDGREASIESSAVVVRWDNVTGTLDGDFGVKVLIGTNEDGDEMYAKHTADVQIDSASNADDCYVFAINYPHQGVKVWFTKNNITGGTLNAAMSYKG